jgi:hypothetical protein
MTLRDIQKLALTLTACFCILLVACAFVISRLYTANTTTTAESCKSTAPVALSAAGDEELKLPDSHQVQLPDPELLVPPKAERLPTPAQPEPPAPTLVSAQTAQRQPTSAARLAVPSGLHPNHLADLRKKPALHMHWNPVPGATQYHVRAWQLRGAQKLMLTDKKLAGLDLHLEPPYSGPVIWQVAGVDEADADGPFSTPLSVEIITPNR